MTLQAIHRSRSRRLRWALLPLLVLPAIRAAAAGDPFEPDDTQAQARTLWSVDPARLPPDLPYALGGSGIPQVHTLHHARDQDWLVFHAEGGEWFEVHVWPEEPALDLSVELYDERGGFLAGADWYSAGKSEWFSYCPKGPSGNLWVRVSTSDYRDTGQPQAYQVALFQPDLEFDGFIFGLVSDGATGRGLEGALVSSSRGTGVLTQSNGAYLMPHASGLYDFTATAPTSSSAVSHSVRIQSLIYAEQDFQLPLAVAADNPGTLSFTAAEFPVSESAGAATVRVERRGGTRGPARVQVRTRGDTATADQDYTVTAGGLEWADGQGGVRTLSIPIADDARFEGRERLRVILDEALGAPLDGWTVAAVVIEDDDPRRPSTFDPATGELVLPDVRVDETPVEARLVWRNDLFHGQSAQPAATTHQDPARYSPQSLRVDIPYVELTGTRQAYRAVLRETGAGTRVFSLDQVLPVAYRDAGF